MSNDPTTHPHTVLAVYIALLVVLIDQKTIKVLGGLWSSAASPLWKLLSQ